MTQHRVKGRFARDPKIAETCRKLATELNATPSPDDEYARTIWTGAGIVFLGYLFAFVVVRGLGAG